MGVSNSIRLFNCKYLSPRPVLLVHVLDFVIFVIFEAQEVDNWDTDRQQPVEVEREIWSRRDQTSMDIRVGQQPTSTILTRQSPANAILGGSTRKTIVATKTAARPIPKPPQQQQQDVQPALTFEKLDISSSQAATRRDLLNDAFLPVWKTEAGVGGPDNPADLQKDDPLGTSIWKLYSRAKSEIPNQQRMENLTWRMMSMNMRKKREAEELQKQQRQHDTSSKKTENTISRDPRAGLDNGPRHPPPPLLTNLKPGTARTKQARQTNRGPQKEGGISQLRKSVDASNVPTDAMQIDEHNAVPQDESNSSGLSLSPQIDTAATSVSTIPSGMSAMPIKSVNTAQPFPFIPPSSFPVPPGDMRGGSEFGYVQRRVRKTSVDDRNRRVSECCHLMLIIIPL